MHVEACAHARSPRPGASGPFAAIARPSSALLVGDFNMAPDSDAYARLLADFGDGTPAWRDAWRLANPGRTHAPTVGLHDRSPGATRLTSDYAFVSADLAGCVRAARVDGAADGSDHQPLLLELA